MTSDQRENNTVEEKREWYRAHSLVYYTEREEFLHVLSHALGVVFAAVMLLFMLLRATTARSYATALLSCCLLGTEFFISAKYHGEKDIKKKLFWRKLDFPAVDLNVLACGTSLCILYGNAYGYVAFALSFTLTAISLLLCLRDFDRFYKLSIFLSFVIGGLLFAAFFVSAFTGSGIHGRPLVGYLYLAGLLLSLIGAIFFRIHRPYMHAVFHLLVLFGPALCMLANFFQLV